MEAVIPPTLQEHDFCLITEGVIGRTMQRRSHKIPSTQIACAARYSHKLLYPGVSDSRNWSCDINTTDVAGH